MTDCFWRNEEGCYDPACGPDPTNVTYYGFVGGYSTDGVFADPLRFDNGNGNYNTNYETIFCGSPSPACDASWSLNGLITAAGFTVPSGGYTSAELIRVKRYRGTDAPPGGDGCNCGLSYGPSPGEYSHGSLVNSYADAYAFDPTTAAGYAALLRRIYITLFDFHLATSEYDNQNGYSDIAIVQLQTNVGVVVFGLARNCCF